jgi:hypothetical protein
MSARHPVDPDGFFAGPAISFSKQPDLKRLFECLIDPEKTFTFVVGAGASLDANLPTWARLIENITELIPNERWRTASKEDRSELLRKAESSVQLARENSNNTAVGIVREALYRRSDGSTNDKPKYGRLADAIARLATCLKGRVYVATVNLDTLLEDAMNEYRQLTNDVKITSVPFIAPQKEDENYASYQQTGVPANWLAGSTVLHLHGILEPGKDREGNIVLTETEFLTYGPAVRDLIKRRLKSSHVVFFGVSLTDPNLVSPLWEVNNEIPRATDEKESFVFSVAAPDPNAVDVNTSRAYAIKKAQYLSDDLGLHTIFLKSYGQQIQAIAEASLAVLRPIPYMTEEDSATSLRYGHRLKRCLNTCYANIGCSETQDIPADEHARALSDRLHSLLNSNRDKSINKILQGVHDRLSTANDRDLLRDYESGVQYFDNEKFGLFLWLRATKGPKDPHARYCLKCVGTSISQHREPWSLDRVAEIKGASRFVSARAAFYGSPKTENFTAANGWLLWHSERAVPFSYYPAPAGDPDNAMTAIDVGVVTLNSTHNYLPLENQWSRKNPRSIFTMTDDAEMAAINDELARIALEVVSTPPKLEHPS